MILKLLSVILPIHNQQLSVNNETDKDPEQHNGFMCRVTVV